jgi:hypothetical protein
VKFVPMGIEAGVKLQATLRENAFSDRGNSRAVETENDCHCVRNKSVCCAGRSGRINFLAPMHKSVKGPSRKSRFEESGDAVHAEARSAKSSGARVIPILPRASNRRQLSAFANAVSR